MLNIDSDDIMPVTFIPRLIANKTDKIVCYTISHNTINEVIDIFTMKELYTHITDLFKEDIIIYDCGHYYSIERPTTHIRIYNMPDINAFIDMLMPYHTVSIERQHMENLPVIYDLEMVKFKCHMTIADILDTALYPTVKLLVHIVHDMHSYFCIVSSLTHIKLRAICLDPISNEVDITMRSTSSKAHYHYDITVSSIKLHIAVYTHLSTYTTDILRSQMMKLINT